jgi:hypothetical protein
LTSSRDFKRERMMNLPFHSSVVSSKTAGMEDKTGQTNSFKDLMQWAITPPQSYAVYVIGLLLVFSLSYLAGTLNPKRSIGTAPPPVSAPRN